MLLLKNKISTLKVFVIATCNLYKNKKSSDRPFYGNQLVKLLSMKNLPILLNTFCSERFLLLRRKWYEMRVTLLWFQLLRVYISDQYYRVQKAVWLFKGALFQLKNIFALRKIRLVLIKIKTFIFHIFPFHFLIIRTFFQITIAAKSLEHHMVL